MSNHNIKIHYLYHSGFAVETEEHFLVFDYYKDSFTGKEKSIENGLISEDFIKDKKNTIVFVSHSHPDHFNPVIFKWNKSNKKIKYILSSDVPVVDSKENYYKLSTYEDITLKEEGVYIKAFGSTDIGISFLIKLEGITLFHSGDLNWWHWKEDPAEDRKSAEINFKDEIDKLKGQKIDIAFFPVDPRLDEYYLSGGEYFIKEIEPRIFFPMHFWSRVSISTKFREAMKNYSTKVMELHSPGEVFCLEIKDLS
ncbi:MBL fold metallo-hydrolase [Clostridium sp. LBM24168]